MLKRQRQHLPNWFTCTTCEMSFVCCENILTKSIFYSWHSGCARIRILMLCALFLSHSPSLSGIVCGFGWPVRASKNVAMHSTPVNEFSSIHCCRIHIRRSGRRWRGICILCGPFPIPHPNWIFPFEQFVQLFRVIYGSANAPIKPESLWNCFEFSSLLMLRE